MSKLSRNECHGIARKDFIRTIGILVTGVPLVAIGGMGEKGIVSSAATNKKLGIKRRLDRILLSDKGGDRATGYVMSNKIVHWNGHILCTWLDFERQNRWALVNLDSGEILRTGALGEPRRDNHCGAAIATDIDRSLHLLIGAHHGTFTHYMMSPGKLDWEPVENGREVGETGTYPSMVCDGTGTLHLLYRRETNGRDAHLVYCRRPKQGAWSAPRTLVRMAVDEHSWLTNAIEVGPSGRLHAVFSNTLPVPEQGANARYYGTSHIYSDDSGQTWQQFGGLVLDHLPAGAASLQRIEGTTLAPMRIEACYNSNNGPLALTSYYHKMVLSNPVVDDRDQPWVIVHNLLTGDAQLFLHEDNGLWVGTPLIAPIPGYRIQHCGQLSRHRDGTIEAVLMVSPIDELGWGASGTTLIRMQFDGKGKLINNLFLFGTEQKMPSWLPSLERWCPNNKFDHPALLYTRGINAGGGKNNINSINTEVWIEQL